MYAFLLILGAVITVAGGILIAPGLPFQGREFDASIITPGAVAIVGGLILIGLGLAVRVLGRIEKALAVQPASRRTLSDAMDASAQATEQPDAAAARIPLPPKPAFEARPKPKPTPAVAAAPSLPEDAALHRLREKFPSLVRAENPPVVEETDVPLLPKAPARADEEAAEFNGTDAHGQVHGQASAAAPAKTEPRIEFPGRSASRPERSKNFDAFWPKKLRPGQDTQPAADTQPATPAAPSAPVEPVLTPEPVQFQFHEPAADARPAAAAAQAPPPLSVLKSGVVDGMAYTLYSDGSIEAQLPQGTLRFGSIADLRHHIEQSA
jgi:hypothetical protein